MSVLAECPACEMGEHDKHVEHWQKAPDGVLGGAHCPCGGGCKGPDLSSLLGGHQAARTACWEPTYLDGTLLDLDYIPHWSSEAEAIVEVAEMNDEDSDQPYGYHQRATVCMEPQCDLCGQKYTDEDTGANHFDLDGLDGLLEGVGWSCIPVGTSYLCPYCGPAEVIIARGEVLGQTTLGGAQ